ncbi:hypothetical protein E2C01_012019 [Portunus trituberculatus]|uniref:Uncharacterized protein n=1 Tax=Portunus trituberculatus TaxID=210409 RepID=A0A5B7DCK9_PORTR|nr:hypothetical protein [Portunus trituberculatus]
MDSTRGCGCQLIYERQCRTGVGAVNSASRPHLDPELFPGPVPLTFCQARSADRASNKQVVAQKTSGTVRGRPAGLICFVCAEQQR